MAGCQGIEQWGPHAGPQAGLRVPPGTLTHQTLRPPSPKLYTSDAGVAVLPHSISGASQRGLPAPPAVVVAAAALVCSATARLRLKSATLACQLRSTSRLADWQGWGPTWTGGGASEGECC